MLASSDHPQRTTYVEIGVVHIQQQRRIAHLDVQFTTAFSDDVAEGAAARLVCLLNHGDILSPELQQTVVVYRERFLRTGPSGRGGLEICARLHTDRLAIAQRRLLR